MARHPKPMIASIFHSACAPISYTLYYSSLCSSYAYSRLCSRAPTPLAVFCPGLSAAVPHVASSLRRLEFLNKHALCKLQLGILQQASWPMGQHCIVRCIMPEWLPARCLLPAAAPAWQALPQALRSGLLPTPACALPAVPAQQHVCRLLPPQCRGWLHLHQAAAAGNQPPRWRTWLLRPALAEGPQRLPAAGASDLAIPQLPLGPPLLPAAAALLPARRQRCRRLRRQRQLLPLWAAGSASAPEQWLAAAAAAGRGCLHARV